MGCRVHRRHRWSVYCVMAPPPGSSSMFRASMKTRVGAEPSVRAGHFAQRVAPRTCVSSGASSRLERRELRVFRPPSLRARGARGGPQAPRHVHRLHRLARAHALPLGDHRQLRRRGPRRPRRRDRRHPAPRRQRRGARPRARHPGRHRAEDRAVRRRGRLHQAARRRQVRRRARTRPPAGCTASAHPSSTRSPSGSTSRSTATARPGRCRSTAASPASSPTPARRRPTRRSRRSRCAASCASSARWPRASPAPASGTGPTGRSSRRAPSSRLEELLGARAPDRVPGARARASTSRDERGGRAAHGRRFQFEGGISEFAEHLAHGRRRHRHLAPHRHRHVHRDGARAAPTAARWCRPSCSASARSTSRCAGAPATTPSSARSSTSSRRPRAAPTRPGFEQGLLKFLRQQVEQNARRLKVGNDKLEKDDVLAGPHRRASRCACPSRSSRARPRRCSARPRCAASSRNVAHQGARRRGSRSTKRDDKAQTALLLDKVVAEMKSRISARAHKETQRRKNALESSSLPAKLVDCRSNDVAHSELFIVEGDSALGTAKLARNSEYQALLPIRGKILNVQKACVSRHARQRRVRLDHPGDRRRLGSQLRPRRPRATARSSS